LDWVIWVISAPTRVTGGYGAIAIHNKTTGFNLLLVKENTQKN